MNTIKTLVVFLFAGVLLTSCSKAKYRKTAGGMPYQLFKGNGTDSQQIKAGDFIKVQFTRKIKDSIYFTTAGTLPVYMQVNNMTQPYDISELWTSLRVGDSVVATQAMDTFMKRDPRNIPPEFKKGDKITYYIKVTGRFSSDSAARADYDKSNKDWLAGEVLTIQKFLEEKKITAQKTPSGAFVETINPGTGNLIDSGKYVSVKYTGTSWSGKKFDTNVDSTFGHTDLLSFTAGTAGTQGGMIKGFDEGIQLMRSGGKAKIYVPSILGYAGNPGSPNIKPYENLVFDIEVLQVQDKAPVAKREMPPIQTVPVPAQH